jgi:uncharacterized alkaline shock family protein YloU
MHKEETSTDLGTVKIHKDVVSNITALAALEIEGIKRIGRSLTSGIWELLGRKSASSIKIEFDKNEEVRIEIPVIIKYDYNIHDVADKVQENVRANIERMTNLSVKDITVDVQAIERG